MMEITTNIPVGKDINAFFKFFLFDQFRGEYLTVQGISNFPQVDNCVYIMVFIILLYEDGMNVILI